MTQFKKINNEVFYTNKTIAQIENSDIAFLKAKKNRKKKNSLMHSFKRKR